MKKIFYLIMAIGILLGNPWMAAMTGATAVSTYSNTVDTVAIGGTTYTVNFRASSGVSVSYTSPTTASSIFNVSSYHSKADKTYGMDSEGGPVFFKSETAAATPTAASGTADFSAWSTL